MTNSTTRRQPLPVGSCAMTRLALSLKARSISPARTSSSNKRWKTVRTNVQAIGIDRVPLDRSRSSRSSMEQRGSVNSSSGSVSRSRPSSSRSSDPGSILPCPFLFSVYSLEHEHGNGRPDPALFRHAQTEPGTRNNHPPVPATSSGNGQETYEAVSLKVEKGWAKSLDLLA